jgi:hypothetical protein
MGSSGFGSFFRASGLDGENRLLFGNTMRKVEEFFRIKWVSLISALFPMETNLENPILSAAAYSRAPTPTAPLWDMKAIFPAIGKLREKVAFNETAGSVLITPKQFGPITAMP